MAEWLLIVPRKPCISIAELDVAWRARLLAIAESASARISAQNDPCVIFEHGPSRHGSATACGVDQAHLHVVGSIPASIEYLSQQIDNVTWKIVDHGDPWSMVPPESDYLMLRDETHALLALIDCPVSQRLRRVVANALGRSDEWDYRTHPQPENALRTKQIFRGEYTYVA